MNLYRLLSARAHAGNPVRIGQIGAGKFGTMFLAQARLTPGMHVVGLADLAPDRARQRLTGIGWPDEQLSATSVSDAVATGKTCVTENALAVVTHPAVEVVIEATGDPATGVRLCLEAIRHGKHVVMVNVEADALAGPLLAKKARDAGVVYSLAWGDQPALIAEQVDWARACGFKVVAAGKGTRYHPSYHQLTPDTVWDVLTQYLPIRDRSHINLKMFNSFLDGTKSAIEMTAVCNACDLVPQTNGLSFPPASRFELADTLKPHSEGGTLEKKGVTEVISSLYRDGSPVPHHLAMGTFVIVESDSPYAGQCFVEYNCLQDKSGRYAALYRPTHMIGLELGISVASVALRGEPTGAPVAFNSDCIATAKTALKAGEMLDGEGGFTVWGKQVPAAASIAGDLLPLGLAHKVKLVGDVAQGDMIRWSDVAIDPVDIAVRVRREMERVFAPGA
ncbi:MAG: flagellar biosynthesis protein FlgA [Hyphomicrobium sp.]|nr:flagellar biosynthesis protein FlgA [Hyphomicrobium sp.]PPC80145.1 MAG: flagellar biosynthesis protein FlgA [Hyphomicrobium sp.]